MMLKLAITLLCLIRAPVVPHQDYITLLAQVNLFVADGAEIGLKIRGGMEHGLGIFIASVERNSGADRAGIQVRYSEKLL